MSIKTKALLKVLKLTVYAVLFAIILNLLIMFVPINILLVVFFVGMLGYFGHLLYTYYVDQYEREAKKDETK
jgi:uncharacterized membrane protein